MESLWWLRQVGDKGQGIGKFVGANTQVECVDTLSVLGLLKSPTLCLLRLENSGVICSEIPCLWPARTVRGFTRHFKILFV